MLMFTTTANIYSSQQFILSLLKTAIYESSFYFIKINLIVNLEQYIYHQLSDSLHNLAVFCQDNSYKKSSHYQDNRACFMNRLVATPREFNIETKRSY